MYAAKILLHGIEWDNYKTLADVVEGKYDWQNQIASKLTYENFITKIKAAKFPMKVSEEYQMAVKLLLSHDSFANGVYAPSHPVLQTVYWFVRRSVIV